MKFMVYYIELTLDVHISLSNLYNSQCGLGNILELAFSGVGMLWWLAASIVFTKQANVSNAAGAE
jgi:hypothetical protein